MEKWKRVYLLCLILVVCQRCTADALTTRECSSDRFNCDRTRCVPNKWLCDGSKDCNDGTDELESNCPDGITSRPETCPEGQFRCQNDWCVPEKWKCDGSNDCGDNSDEEGCVHTCTVEEFHCSDGQCISDTFKCDGNDDCADGSDEKNCTAGEGSLIQSSSIYFTCGVGNRIPKSWLCDGAWDCGDGSDEEGCFGGTKSDVDLDENAEPEEKKDEPCPNRYEFRCPSAFCIKSDWLCDGIDDCPHGEDEHECNERECNQLEMKCGDGACIPWSAFCDGEMDCRDGLDEKSCVHGINRPMGAQDPYKLRKHKTYEYFKAHTTTTTPQSVTSAVSTKATTVRKEVTPEAVKIKEVEEKEKCDESTNFQCDGGDKCLNMKEVCDGIADCQDSKDESIETCGENECETANGGCQHDCVNTREGHECTCRDGYRKVNKYSCEDIDECKETFGICSQGCLNTEGRYRCFCFPGYMRDPANYTRCKATVGEVYLLFSHSYDIRSLRLRDHDMTSVVSGTRGAIALDFLFDEEQILWSDKKDKKIYRANMSDTLSSREVLAGNEEVSVDGLAVDWLHGNVYYTDTLKSSVKMLSWDAKWSKTIIEDKLHHPRAIVVSPISGYIYWSDWGTDPKIERSRLDGSERTAIIEFPHVVWPNGMVLDHSQGKLYWCDGRLMTISSANMDGTNVEVILYSPDFLRQPFSISVFEDRLYWTDWARVALFSANKFNGENIQNVSAGHLIESPKVVHVYHKYRQPDGENVCQNNRCSQFCIRCENGSPKCICSDGFDLARDGITCIQKDSEQRTINEPAILTSRDSFINDSLKLIKEGEESSQIGVIIGAVMVVVVIIIAAVLVYIFQTKFGGFRNQSIQRIRFHNPIYKGTTVDQEDDLTFSKAHERMTSSFLPSGPELMIDVNGQTTDWDEEPLAPRLKNREEV